MLSLRNKTEHGKIVPSNRFPKIAIDTHLEDPHCNQARTSMRNKTHELSNKQLRFNDAEIATADLEENPCSSDLH